MKDYFLNLFRRLKDFREDEKGQALVEYALILLLIAIVVILMLTGLGGNVNNVYSQMNSAMTP